MGSDEDLREARSRVRFTVLGSKPTERLHLYVSRLDEQLHACVANSSEQISTTERVYLLKQMRAQKQRTADRNRGLYDGIDPWTVQFMGMTTLVCVIRSQCACRHTCSRARGHVAHAACCRVVSSRFIVTRVTFASWLGTHGHSVVQEWQR